MAMNSPFESLISTQGNDLTNWLCDSVIVFTNITNLPALFDFIPISIESNITSVPRPTIIFYR
jgi:hypothetical protein